MRTGCSLTRYCDLELVGMREQDAMTFLALNFSTLVCPDMRPPLRSAGRKPYCAPYWRSLTKRGPHEANRRIFE